MVKTVDGNLLTIENKKSMKNVKKTMKKYKEYRWWESDDPIEVAMNQIFESIFISKFSFFKEGLEKLLGRDIQHIEFAFNMDELREETSEAIKRLELGILTLQNKDFEMKKQYESIKKCMKYREELGLKTFIKEVK